MATRPEREIQADATKRYLAALRTDFRSDLMTGTLAPEELAAAVEQAVINKVCDELTQAVYGLKSAMNKDWKASPLPQKRNEVRRWMDRCEQLLQLTEQMELRQKAEADAAAAAEEAEWAGTV